MRVEELAQMQRTQHFRPYRIHMADRDRVQSRRDFRGDRLTARVRSRGFGQCGALTEAVVAFRVRCADHIVLRSMNEGVDWDWISMDANDAEVTLLLR